MKTIATHLTAPFLSAPSLDGRVHSVFEHAMNVELGQNLFTFVADDSVDFPDSMVVAPADFAVLRRTEVDEPVHKRDGAILFPNRGITVQLAGPNNGNTFPQGCRPATPEEQARRLEQIYRDLAPSVVDLPPRIEQLATRLSNALADRDLPACGTCIGSLIGLGNGLTPSGDDVLLGVLAVLRFLVESGEADRSDGAFFAAFTEMVGQQAEGNTTDVSIKYLRCAGEGRFSLPLIAGVRSFLDAGHAVDMVGLRHLVSTGSTSGSDMLRGIVCAATSETGFRVSGFGCRDKLEAAVPAVISCSCHRRGRRPPVLEGNASRALNSPLKPETRHPKPICGACNA